MKAIKDQLHWQQRQKGIPTTPIDRCVAKLRYGEDSSEMGLVCETAEGTFWSFTTNPAIACMKPRAYLIKYDTLEKACEALYDYVVSEVYRVIRIESNMPYEIERKFKKRDKIAYEEYQDAIQTDDDAFKCGMDWILRSEGFPRRPDWARFLVQNRSGDYAWFETKPHIDHNMGVWTCTVGRAKLVRAEDWTTSIVRLT